jgi:hypothetical protein
MTTGEGLPDHANAVAEWLRGDTAIDTGWVEARNEAQHTIVTLHLPDHVHDDRREVLAFRAGLALRRFDPELGSVDVEFARLSPTAPRSGPGTAGAPVDAATLRPADSICSAAALTFSTLVGWGTSPA